MPDFSDHGLAALSQGSPQPKQPDETAARLRGLLSLITMCEASLGCMYCTDVERGLERHEETCPRERALGIIGAMLAALSQGSRPTD